MSFRIKLPYVMLHKKKRLRKELFKAVKSGNIQQLKTILEEDVDVNGTDENGETALAFAVWSGNLEIVEHLLDAGADIENCDKNGETPLMFAAEWGRLEVLKFLIKKGANIHKCDRTRKTALMKAQVNAQDEVVTYLQESVQKYWDRKLLDSALEGDVPNMKCALEHGANINIEDDDEDGRTPLALTASYGKVSAAEYLINAGANLQSDGIQSLFWATAGGNLEIVKLLHERGININAQHSSGNTPIMVAVQNNKLKIVDYFISKGVNVNKTHSKGMTPLSCAVINNNIKMAEFLLSNGAHFSAHTALLNAIVLGDLSMIELLIDFEADVNSRYHNGYTPLIKAVEMKNAQIVNLLLSCGADVNLDDVTGKLPLTEALDDPELTKILVYAGADLKPHAKNLLKFIDDDLDMLRLFLEDGTAVDVVGECGYTLLTKCIKLEKFQMVSYLIETGANVNLANRHVVTPLIQAVQTKKIQFVKQLVEFDADVNFSIGANSPLKQSIEQECSDITYYLINNGANVKPHSHLLTKYIKNRDLKWIKLFTEKGADLNVIAECGHTPLTKGVQTHNLPVLKYLVENGATVNAVDKNGNTALSIAAANLNLQMVDYLITVGADVNLAKKEIDGFIDRDENFYVYMINKTTRGYSMRSRNKDPECDYIVYATNHYETLS